MSSCYSYCTSGVTTSSYTFPTGSTLQVDTHGPEARRLQSPSKSADGLTRPADCTGMSDEGNSQAPSAISRTNADVSLEQKALSLVVA